MEEIITLEEGQALFSNPNLKVFKGGDYTKTDLVLVIEDGFDIPYYQYQANYIKTGEMI